MSWTASPRVGLPWSGELDNPSANSSCPDVFESSETMMDDIMAKVTALQVEAEQAGHALVWQMQGKTESGLRVSDCSPSEAAAFIDNCEQSDVTLKIGKHFWHGHSALLSRHSQFFRDLFGSGPHRKTGIIDVPLPYPNYSDTEVLMVYLYTGNCPSGTRFTGHALETAHNARYAATDALYKASAKHLAEVWQALYAERKEEFSAAVDVDLMVITLAYMANRDLDYQMQFMCAACADVGNTDWMIAVTRHPSGSPISDKLKNANLQSLRSQFAGTTAAKKGFALLPATAVFDNAVAERYEQRTIVQNRPGSVRLSDMLASMGQ